MDWNIAKNSKLCLPCGMGFKEQEEFFSALYEDGDRFFRNDICLNCWSGFDKDGVFSFWKSRLPERGVPVRPELDIKVILDIFSRLGSETNDRSRINLRYFLALYLARKRVFKFRATLMREGIDYMLLYHPEEAREIMVYIPELTADEVAQTTDEVRRLLNNPDFAVA